MINYSVPENSANVSVIIRIVDSDGHTPETAVVFNTSGINLQYRREGAANVSITEADLDTPSLTDPHLEGGFLHIGNGYYRLDLPDAAVAEGVDGVLVHGTVTGMIVQGCYVHLNGKSRQAATKMEKTANQIIEGNAVTGTLSSSAMTTNLTETSDDHYVGRTIIWTSGVLAGSQAKITSYNGTSKIVSYGGGTSTGESPSNSDTFIIV